MAIPIAAASPAPRAETSSLSSTMAGAHARELGFVGGRKIKSCRRRELLLRTRLVAPPVQRLAPFEMQPAPVGRVLVRFLEFRAREIGAVLRDQCFTPHLER